MANVHIEIDEQELKRIVVVYLESKLGYRDRDEKNLTIEVKSSQIYKSEWEPAHYRATYKGTI